MITPLYMLNRNIEEMKKTISYDTYYLTQDDQNFLQLKIQELKKNNK